MRRLIWFIGICLIVACSKPMIAAFGSNSEVLIVTTPRCASEAAKLKNILEREIVTVQYEKAFNVRIVTAADLRTELTRKNIVLLDFLTPVSDLEGRIRDVAGASFGALEEGNLNRCVAYDR